MDHLDALDSLFCNKPNHKPTVAPKVKVAAKHTVKIAANAVP